MSPQQFINLVRRMRSAQRQELRTMSVADMQQAKEYEKQVDDALRGFSIQKNQTNNFDTSPSS
jgi:hypothetical protein